MKFNDFLKIQISKEIGNPIPFLDYYEWLMENNYSNLSSEILSRLETKSITRRTEEQLFLDVVATSPKEKNSKLSQKEFYDANAQLFYLVFTRMFDDKLHFRLSLEECSVDIRRNYENIFLEFIYSLLELISEYDKNIKKEEKEEIIINRMQHTMPFHQTLRQILYGQTSFHSFMDMEPFFGTTIIRQLIELRIRRAFGIIFIEDDNGAIIPISFSKILETIEEQKEKIFMPISFATIKKIYKWSNMYVHSGIKDYVWMPYSIEHILRPLTFGEEDEMGNWDINNGISTTLDVICNMKKSILSKYDNKNYSIPDCSPECKIVSI